MATFHNTGYFLIVLGPKDGSTRGARFAIQKTKGNEYYVDSTEPELVRDGSWHHLVGVNDGTDLLLYVDGELDNTNPGAGGKIKGDEGATLNIGRRVEEAGDYLFNGCIDEVAIYSRALTPEEIKQHYRMGKP